MKRGGYNKFNLFKSKIISYPEISSLTATSFSTIPVDDLETIKITGVDEERKSIFCDELDITYDFIKTFGIRLKGGRDLTEENFILPKDDYYGNYYYCLITESLVKALNLTDPIGKTMEVMDEDHVKIVGIVEDFYVTSFYKEPKPIVLWLWIHCNSYDSYFIRLANNANKEKSISLIKNVWSEVFPDTNFKYSFYKDDYKKLYQRTYSTIKMVMVFSLFALILSTISIYGMSNHISNIRLKEMTVRRVIGATVKENFIAMTKSFFNLTLICNIISIPVSVVIYKLWQRQFSFCASLSYVDVGYTLLTSLFIVLVAVSANLLRTANKPIVEVLRDND